MNLTSLLVFIVANTLGTLIPGPAAFLSLKVGLEKDWKRSALSAAGLTSVAFVFALLSLIGIGAVIETSERLFFLLKTAGAIFLIYLGIKTLVSSVGMMDSCDRSKSRANAFLGGVIVGMGNPNALLFFIAIFPQLFDMKSFSFRDYVICLAVLNIIVFSCMILYSLIGTMLMKVLSSRRILRIINSVMGSILIALGVSMFN